jgi:hypothetical protein
MKRSISAIVIVSVLAVGGALWLWRSYLFRGVNHPRPTRQLAVSSAARESPTPHLAPVAHDDDEASDHPDPATIRRAIEAGNVPINLWGKVIDQDGLPLSEVRVAYTYSIYHGNDQGVAWIDLETREGEATSDSDGSFAITDLTGHDLTIESLTKMGYVYRYRSLSYDFGGNMPDNRFKARRDNPIRVTMIHKNAMESLIHVRGGVDVRGDGTAEHWNLWSGEADPRGEFTIVYRAVIAVPANPAQRVNWSADLGIVGGGITEAPWNEDVRRAPESGYSATVAYPKRDQIQGVPHRSFYVHTADGKYGRVQVELSPSLDELTARCFITSDMNPRPDSRNLEPADED